MTMEMVDTALKLSLTAVLIVWLFSSGSVFESEYYDKLVNLYTHPWWRWLLIALLVAGSMWYPVFAVAMMMAVFFYFADIEVFVK